MRAAIVGAVFAASACGRQLGWCGLGAGRGLDGAVLCGRQQADTRAARWRVCGLAGGRVATDAGCVLRGAQRVACACAFFIMQKHGGRQVLPVNFAGKGTGGDDG